MIVDARRDGLTITETANFTILIFLSMVWRPINWDLEDIAEMFIFLPHQINK